jgi:hypothetical protein
VEKSVLPEQDGGSIPTPPLHFSKCPLKEVALFVDTNHYSHSHHKVVSYAFKLEMNGVLAGACLFGMIAGNPKAVEVLTGYETHAPYLELQRLVLLDEVPKNSESRFVAWCLRWLQKNTDVKAVISFADPKYGHKGIIYRAGNWLYLGKQGPCRDRMFLNGKEMHPKQFYNLYGTSSLVKLKEMGIGPITTSFREPKHKYVYILRNELRSLLKFPIKPYN